PAMAYDDGPRDAHHPEGRDGRRGPRGPDLPDAHGRCRGTTAPVHRGECEVRDESGYLRTDRLSQVGAQGRRGLSAPPSFAFDPPIRMEPPTTRSPWFPVLPSPAMELLPLLVLLQRAAARIFFRISRAGPAVPATGPVLLVANHQNSLLDPSLLQVAAERPVRFLAKAPLFRDPVVGPLVRA